MFERFSQNARRTVVLAQEEARDMRHDRIGTQHLLLAMVVDGRDAGARVLLDHGFTAAEMRRHLRGDIESGGLDGDALATLGIDLDAVREATEAAFGPGALTDPKNRAFKSGHIPFTPQAKKALELSLRETLHLGTREIGTGQLLLGILRGADGPAVRLLTQSGHDLDLQRLREEVISVIESEAA